MIGISVKIATSFVKNIEPKKESKRITKTICLKFLHFSMINPAKNFKIPKTSKIEIRIIKLSKAIKVFTSMSEVLTVPKPNESKGKNRSK